MSLESILDFFSLIFIVLGYFLFISVSCFALYFLQGSSFVKKLSLMGRDLIDWNLLGHAGFIRVSMDRVYPYLIRFVPDV